MSCKIKNVKCPFQIQCLFPTAANDTQPFALYFYSSLGSQEQVVSCGYNGHGKCYTEDGFNITHEAYNNLTITVPDTFATRKGSFKCQKGDIPMVKNCSYPPPEICDIISSTQSGIGLGTATKDDNTSIVIGVAFGVVVVILILILGIVFFMRQRKNKHKRSTDESSVSDGANGSATKRWSKRYNDGPSVSIREECNNHLLERESTGTNDDQLQIDLPSATVDIRPESLINGFQQVSTAGEETATGDQNTYPHTIIVANRALPINQL